MAKAAPHPSAGYPESSGRYSARADRWSERQIPQRTTGSRPVHLAEMVRSMGKGLTSTKMKPADSAAFSSRTIFSRQPDTDATSTTKAGGYRWARSSLAPADFFPTRHTADAAAISAGKPLDTAFSTDRCRHDSAANSTARPAPWLGLQRYVHFRTTDVPNIQGHRAPTAHLSRAPRDPSANRSVQRRRRHGRRPGSGDIGRHARPTNRRPRTTRAP